MNYAATLRIHLVGVEEPLPEVVYVSSGRNRYSGLVTEATPRGLLRQVIRRKEEIELEGFIYGEFMYLPEHIQKVSITHKFEVTS